MNGGPAPLHILGLGAALPQQVVTNAEVEQRCELAQGWIARRSGVHQRRWITPGLETAASLGAAAAREALQEAALNPEDIDLIINASGTQAQPVPDGGPLLQQALGLAGTGIPSWSVHSTCLSFITALDLAAQLLNTARYRHILVVSSEVSSAGINFDEPESASLLGDGAAAAVLARTIPGEAPALLTSRMETYSEGAALTQIRGGGTLLHPNAAGATPNDFLFHMNGPQVLRLACARLAPFLEALRPGLSRGLTGLDWVVPHQASAAGLSLLQRFGWPVERTMRTLEHTGNCVAASVPLALHHGVRSGQIRRGDEVFLLGTGAGFGMGGVILRY